MASAEEAAVWPPSSTQQLPPNGTAVPGATVLAEGSDEWSTNNERGGERGRQKGIVVRNTFIDVCPLEEDSEGDGEGSQQGSPTRRNASAPPSPSRRAQKRAEGKEGGEGDDAVGQLDDSDQEEEADPTSIPQYQWTDSGLVTAEGDEDKETDETLSESMLPAWLRKAPGSPKKVMSTEAKETTSPKAKANPVPEASRPALGEFLKGGSPVWGGPAGVAGATPQRRSSFATAQDFGAPGDSVNSGLQFGRSLSAGASGTGVPDPRSDPREYVTGWGDDVTTAGYPSTATGQGNWNTFFPSYATTDIFQDRNPAPTASCFGTPTCLPVLTQQRIHSSSNSWMRPEEQQPQPQHQQQWPYEAGGFHEKHSQRDPWRSGLEAPVQVGKGAVAQPPPPPVLASQPLPTQVDPRQGAPAFAAPQHWVPPGGLVEEYDRGYIGLCGQSQPPLAGSHYPIGASLMDNQLLPPDRGQYPRGRPWTRMERDRMDAMAVGGPAGRGAGHAGAIACGENQAGCKGCGKGSTNPGGEGKGNDRGRVPLSGGGPKRTDYVKKYGPVNEHNESITNPTPPGGVPITTLMLKNIPCRKSQEEVMSHIDQKGFGNRYDFFYLPRDVKFRANLGYAFINFLTPEDATAFSDEMNGYRFSSSGSVKACTVVPAHVQGLVNNLAAFKRTEVMRSSRKPFFSSVVAF